MTTAFLGGLVGRLIVLLSTIVMPLGLIPPAGAAGAGAPPGFLPPPTMGFAAALGAGFAAGLAGLGAGFLPAGFAAAFFFAGLLLVTNPPVVRPLLGASAKGEQ